ncbi:hypothetical protein [Mesorhizobium sp. M7A.F.Ca.MR.362.00.0.0]|uniref:hypothetical protein n=1 Tax=Mesorhizobium sp. M7A.F.Ca.MR.362.00.0.0 TaxID=2496779 RepID=UPI000FD5A01C|nr:hypothetical protein [Mesorhizobium sp. M7A.F.Ca.MR.362.00.0.0]RUU81571.1 hypothetical protein EOC06_07660 [Mesorhizobium sp. M7A.F.Ca.MR.362.00.0.0]
MADICIVAFAKAHRDQDCPKPYAIKLLAADVILRRIAEALLKVCGSGRWEARCRRGRRDD